jgi:peptide methionine sulfoxide reductase MsrA
VNQRLYEAEDHHQQYFEKQGRTSCHAGLRTAV